MNNPALIEPDCIELGLAKRRCLYSESNKSAALTLLSLKCCGCDDTAFAASSGRNDGSTDGTGHPRTPVAFQRNQSHGSSICSNISHDGDNSDDNQSRSSSCFRSGNDSKKRKFSARRECHPLTKMALARPGLLLQAGKATTVVSAAPVVKNGSSFDNWIRLPQGRPMPLAPRLPSRILQAPPRVNKMYALKKE